MQYHSLLIKENKFNIKKMWQILNKTIGKHNDNEQVTDKQ